VYSRDFSKKMVQTRTREQIGPVKKWESFGHIGVVLCLCLDSCLSKDRKVCSLPRNNEVTREATREYVRDQ